MLFRDSVDVFCSQYFYALKTTQKVIAHAVGCYLSALLNFFYIFLRGLVLEKLHEDQLLDIGKDDILYLDIYDKTCLFCL
jgi:hypothetical protein